MATAERCRLLLVTGKLAEPALRRMLAELRDRLSVEADVAVLPITVAALATTPWIARHLSVPPGVERIVLPGLCQGSLDEIQEKLGIAAVRGPEDLGDLPEYLGSTQPDKSDYGGYDLEILAEINHAPRLSMQAILDEAQRLARDGADIIDLGCDPGGPWSGVGEAARRLRDRGWRVSIDSFDPVEVGHAVQAGAELVLSVNSSNVAAAKDWGCEVVAIPDTPADLASLERTAEQLADDGVPFRLDPILEPIGFGFATSLGRYLNLRQRYPDAAMLMGVGNLTELTDVDSAGINVLLAGFCQDLRIQSVLTTQVINWCRSCVRELDFARRLMWYAARHHTLPKRLEPNLLLLRDPRIRRQGAESLGELYAAIRDRNWRIFAEDDGIHALNCRLHAWSDDPFELFNQMLQTEEISAQHAFYLGYEMAKAQTARALGKAYVQDRALRWGFLTQEEDRHHGPKESVP